MQASIQEDPEKMVISHQDMMCQRQVDLYGASRPRGDGGRDLAKLRRSGCNSRDGPMSYAVLDQSWHMELR